MIVNDLYEKHIRHLVLNARDLPASLAFDLTFVTGSSVGNATWLLLLRHSLAFTSIHRAGQRTSGWAMYPTDPERWNWTKSDKNLFNFSYEMTLNANYSLYLWKTLLTKSAVAGFQLWVSSWAAFCLASRRFSLLRDKEVDVCWLVVVLGCQLITCSDAKQGSRSSPSIVSYV